jgi:hypothetical protein
MQDSGVGIGDYSGVGIGDYSGTQIEKGFVGEEELIKAREGLIPIRKHVVDKNGHAFMRTYWVRPRDIASFKSTEAAAEFLLATAESAKYLSEVARRLGSYNEDLAKSVYESMQNLEQKSIKLGDKVIEISKWAGNMQANNLQDFLAAMNAQKEEGKSTWGWGDIEKTFASIVYRLSHSGLKISGPEDMKDIKMSVQSEVAPENWGVKITGAIGLMKKKMGEAAGKFMDIMGKRKVQDKENKFIIEEEGKKQKVKDDIAKRPRKKIEERRFVKVSDGGKLKLVKKRAK